ncbi:thymidine phosphorylase [Azospirillum sp. TSH7]|uniref:thymidine phosphorylase family protein n=1 Tax=unclassified Azospirillum TaxID=2630922 RepID=UPI000D62242A|nr:MULTISPECIES: thymidine phosphorylase family protein [unclassified Azospirillum]PWC63190.1 thymidine phosphorylase [Azospirillum sp. TSH20]PWC63343.1 thymidine phosphorylase [Azospirillum sp. TSH7]
MLTLRHLAIDTVRENVAFLNRRCTRYHVEDFLGLGRVEVRNDGRSLLAVLNIVDDPAIVAPDEIGLSDPAFGQLGLAEGSAVHLVPPTPPESFELVRAKVGGAALTDDQLAAIIRDITDQRYSKIEIAAFLIACASFMTTAEVLGLTRAMVAAGTRLHWDGPNGIAGAIADKHCIGGIPGNRTSMIVVPIVAAHGLPIPKTSSRAITSPAGTADTMEVLANVDVPMERMQALVREAKGCLVWGGHVRLSPADDILISVERPLAIDTREQLVASILSKKVAAGSTHLLIDIPVGPSAKIRSAGDAVRLRKLFEHVGDRLGLTLEVAITDGSQPVGRGIGPVLEARDVMAVLRNDPACPADLKERALLLAGRILEFDPAVRGGSGNRRARDLLESGAALASMERIIAMQGPPPAVATLGSLVAEVASPVDGVVSSLDCYRLARIARLAGAPTDKGAGIDLLRKVGDPVRRGEPLYRIHASTNADFTFAQAYAADDNGVRVVG